MSDDRVAVLDASAMLAYLQDEPGADVVEEALATGVLMSAANWAEVLSKLAEVNQRPRPLCQRLTREGLLGAAVKIVPLDADLAIGIAELRPKTKKHGLSLGDRACLALGKAVGLPVLTTDKAWASVKVRGIKVRMAR